MADLSIAIEILGKDSFSGVAKGVTGTLGSLFEGASKLGMGVFGITQLAQGIGSLASGMVSGNAQMETYQSQLETLMGSADLAKDRIAQLAQIGADTPFELPQLVQSEKILMGFGLTSEKTMKLSGKSLDQFRTSLGDMAAGTGTDLGELTNLWGKFSSGATGEAISRLQELGIVTREQLTEVGVQFSKSGELISPLPQAMEAAMKIADSKFGGGMQKLSQTFEGQMSTLADGFNQAKVAIMAPVFDVLKDSLVGVNQFLASGTFKDGLASISALMAGGVKSGIEGIRAGFAALQPVIQIASDAFTTIQQVFAGDWSADDSIDPVVNAVGQLAGVFQQVGFLAEAFGASVDQALSGDLEGALGGMTDALAEILPNITTQLGAWANAFLSWIGPMIPPLLQQLGGLLAEMEVWFLQVALPAYVTQLSTWAAAFVDWVGPMIPPLLHELGGMLIQVGSWLATVALPIIATNLATWGLAFVEWVAPRIPLLIGELAKLELELITWTVTDAGPAIVNALLAWGAAFVDWIGAEVLPNLPAALETIGAAITGWVDGAIAGIEADLSDVGAAIVLGIEGGISDAWGHLQTFFSGLLGSLFTGAQGLIEAHSPSRLAARLIGQPIALGIAGGILEGSGQVSDAVRAIVDQSLKVGIPPMIALALAKAESGLDPKAVGDNGASVGLFQLHERGQGAGLSAADRMDPVINATRFLTEAHAALYRQLVAEGYVGDALVETFGRLAEVSDPQYAYRYSDGLHAVVAEFGNVDLAAVHTAATQKTGVVAAKATTDAICATVAHLPECMTSAGNASSVALVGSLTSGLPMVTTAAQQISGVLVNALAPVPDDFAGIAAAAARQLSSGLTQGMPEAASAATLIADSVLSELDPLPSLAAALGEDLGAEMASGIRDSTKEAVRAAERMVDSVADALSGGAIDMLGGFKMPHFAGGGMVPGSGPLAAVVHGGEMILNPPQQAAIFGGGGGGGGGGDVYFSFPNYVGSRSELMSTVKSGLMEYKRSNGKMPWE